MFSWRNHLSRCAARRIVHLCYTKPDCHPPAGWASRRRQCGAQQYQRGGLGTPLVVRVTSGGQGPICLAAGSDLCYNPVNFPAPSRRQVDGQVDISVSASEAVPIHASVSAKSAAFVQDEREINDLHAAREQTGDLALFHVVVFTYDVPVRAMSEISW